MSRFSALIFNISFAKKALINASISRVIEQAALDS